MKKALLLVDIQYGYISGDEMELVDMKEAVEKATELLKIFRTSDKLVFLSNICLRDQREFRSTPCSLAWLTLNL